MVIPETALGIKLFGIVAKLEGGIFKWIEMNRNHRKALGHVYSSAYEELVKAQLTKDHEDICTGRIRLDYDSGRLIPVDQKHTIIQDASNGAGYDITQSPNPVSPFSELVASTAQTHVLRRTINLLNIVLLATREAEQMSGDSTTADPNADSTHEFELDWFIQWRNRAQDVSEENMQCLWAKLLAGEVSKPGACSLRTLNFLSHMSTEEAKILAKIGPFVTSYGIIKFNDGNKFYHDIGISNQDFKAMEEIDLIKDMTGAISYGGSIIYENIKGRAESICYCNGQAIVIDGGEFKKSAQIKFNVASVTKTARELLPLGAFPANEDLINQIAKAAFEQGAHKVMCGTVDNEKITNLRQVHKKQPATYGDG